MDAVAIRRTVSKGQQERASSTESKIGRNFVSWVVVSN
jgi:hypothetical protein